ncbi:MAG: response regulator [Fibrobacteria bacterium]|nr:response regulator [Fibrobacteria bacterium]
MAYTVLLVDDSETIREAMVRAFAMAKLPMDEILRAANGAEALQVLRERWVDLVLTDINMPTMGGEELVRAMKSDAELSDIPVAVLSSDGSKSRIDRLSALGVVGYLRKPCRPEAIRDLLHSVLGEWQ